MALTVTHPFVCALADDPVADAAGEVVPSDWNADHDISVTSLTIATGTITASEPVLDLSQTWDAGAVTFTGIKLAITDIDSITASLPVDISVNGTSIFQIEKFSFVNFISLYTPANRFRINPQGLGMEASVSGETRVVYSHDGIYLPDYGTISWSASYTNIPAGTQTILLRDATGVVAQRNGTNAQTFRVYGTYTDSSNYVRASLSSSSTAVTLAAETAGTGADNVPVNITPAGTEGTQFTNFAQLTEMTAPAAGAANTARIYAEDNGGGKTRLMVIFASGAAQQIAIEP